MYLGMTIIYSPNCDLNDIIDKYKFKLCDMA